MKKEKVDSEKWRKLWGTVLENCNIATFYEFVH